MQRRQRFSGRRFLGDEKIDFQQLVSADQPTRVTLNNETLLAAKAIWMREQAKDGSATESLVTLSLGHSIGSVLPAPPAAQSRSAPQFRPYAASRRRRFMPLRRQRLYRSLFGFLRHPALGLRSTAAGRAGKIRSCRRGGQDRRLRPRRRAHGPLRLPHRRPCARQRPFRAFSACTAICRFSSPDPAHAISTFWKAACATALRNPKPSVSAACQKMAIAPTSRNWCSRAIWNTRFPLPTIIF